MQGLVGMISGDLERELRDAEDYYFSAPSRRSYYAQHLVFATVIADADMVSRAVGLDAWEGAVPGRVGGRRRQGG